jgi:hypothetical protein
MVKRRVAGRHCMRLSTPSSASISVNAEALCTASLNRPGLSNRLSLASSVATAIPHVGCNIRVSHPHFETQTSSPPARERWQRRRRPPRALSAASISIREGHILARIGDENPGFRPNRPARLPQPFDTSPVGRGFRTLCCVAANGEKGQIKTRGVKRTPSLRPVLLRSGASNPSTSACLLLVHAGMAPHLPRTLPRFGHFGKSAIRRGYEYRYTLRNCAGDRRMIDPAYDLATRERSACGRDRFSDGEPGAPPPRLCPCD